MGLDIIVNSSYANTECIDKVFTIPSCWLEGYFIRDDNDEEVYFDEESDEEKEYVECMVNHLKEFSVYSSTIREFLDWTKYWKEHNAIFSYIY